MLMVMYVRLSDMNIVHSGKLREVQELEGTAAAIDIVEDLVLISWAQRRGEEEPGEGALCDNSHVHIPCQWMTQKAYRASRRGLDGFLLFIIINNPWKT